VPQLSQCLGRDDVPECPVFTRIAGRDVAAETPWWSSPIHRHFLGEPLLDERKFPRPVHEYLDCRPGGCDHGPGSYTLTGFTERGLGKPLLTKKAFPDKNFYELKRRFFIRVIGKGSGFWLPSPSLLQQIEWLLPEGERSSLASGARGCQTDAVFTEAPFQSEVLLRRSTEVLRSSSRMRHEPKGGVFNSRDQWGKS